MTLDIDDSEINELSLSSDFSERTRLVKSLQECHYYKIWTPDTYLTDEISDYSINRCYVSKTSLTESENDAS